MTKKPKNWEKSVDELLHDILSAHDKNDYGERAIGIDGLKQLIKSLSSQRTNEIIKKIKHIGNNLTIKSPKCYCKTYPEHNCGITSNEAIDDFSQDINKLTQKYDQTN